MDARGCAAHLRPVVIEERKHLVSHQVNGFGHRPNVDARFEASDAARENIPRIGPRYDLPLNQELQHRHGGCAIGDGDAFGATAEKADHRRPPLRYLPFVACFERQAYY
jgi:hypothetical protein